MRWSGKIVLELRKISSYLVDNDLSPEIAKALRLFDFDIIHHNEVPQFQNRPQGIEDPEVIDWCRQNGRVWITADKAARKQHEVQIKTARISVLWLHGPPRAFPSWTQFKIVVRVLDQMERLLQSAHGALHFRASQKTGTRPKIMWAESPSDIPRHYQ